MGISLNPGNTSFTRISGPRYVDKTGLISLMNERIGKDDNLICVSRPRRFGKSYAAKMLTAYYDRSCDSRSLFDDKQIAGRPEYKEHLNQYNVICLDISGFTSEVKKNNGSLRSVPGMIEKALMKDFLEQGAELKKDDTFNSLLLRFIKSDGGKPFIFIIDVWDAVIREAKDDPDAQNAYLHLLRNWFKNENFTPKAVAAAYMTGILPIKKYGSQSAISDFKEYSVLAPGPFGPYVGFTEAEVQKLCHNHHISFETMKQWYDGYAFPGVGPVYNPNSVVTAIENRAFAPYWSESSSAATLLEYISKDYNGLTKAIAELIGGISVNVNPTGFANDLTTIRGKNDVLTLLVHLGYLAFDAERKTVRIPNEEIRQEFQQSIRYVTHPATLKRLEESEKLFWNTLRRQEEAVTRQIEQIHMEETAPIHDDREESLRSVIKLAYYTHRDHYAKFEELPCGEGFADVVYFPRHDSDWPALLVELKWNKRADGAINQILNRKYPSVLQNLGTPILLAVITYDKDTKSVEKKHTCKIIPYNESLS